MLGALQLVGALLILLPFVALQMGRTAADSAVYLWPNLAGAALLAVLAAIGEDWGFLLLETVWAGVTAWSLLRRAPA